jgi:decaprenyl-phosphate phosphoribosyltransferase
LVFVAPAAAGAYHHPKPIWQALGTFGIFCAAASAIYLVNDIMDVESDRQHPEKRFRPIASGQLPINLALLAGIVLGAASLGASWALGGWKLTLVVGMYIAISVSYTAYLKREPVVELACVASGFVLRALAGGVATHVPISNWFLAVTSFGALFVATGKRSAELRVLGDNPEAHRAALADYSTTFLQSTLTLTASVTVTAYCLWAFGNSGIIASDHHGRVFIELTVIPVIIGVLHVLRLLDKGEGGAPEDLVLRDHVLQILGLMWVALFAIGIYR